MGHFFFKSPKKIGRKYRLAFAPDQHSPVVEILHETGNMALRRPHCGVAKAHPLNASAKVSGSPLACLRVLSAIPLAPPVAPVSLLLRRTAPVGSESQYRQHTGHIRVIPPRESQSSSADRFGHTRQQPPGCFAESWKSASLSSRRCRRACRWHPAPVQRSAIHRHSTAEREAGQRRPASRSIPIAAAGNRRAGQGRRQHRMLVQALRGPGHFDGRREGANSSYR